MISNLKNVAKGKKMFVGESDNGEESSAITEEFADKNFHAARLYLDKNGNLCVMGYIMTNIGTGGFYGFVPIYEYEAESLLSPEEYNDYYYTLFSNKPSIK